MTAGWYALLAGLFLLVFAGTLLSARLLQRITVNERLDVIARLQPIAKGPSGGPWITRVRRLGGLMSRLSLPEGNWQDSPLRVRFFHAGLRSTNAPIVYFSAKSAFTFITPLLLLAGLTLFHVHLPPHQLGALIVLTAGIGYILPNVVLERLIERRQKSILRGFPDALDLISVCIEAGLGLDAAMEKVATDSSDTCRPLAEELHLVTLELRAGSSRERALRNLARRSGTEDVGVLVAMLIQAERFGSSIADSLIVYSQMLRTKRQQAAEERAAKLATKLLMPLMLCIFPSMLLVLMGPAMLNIYHALLPSLTGH